MKNLEPKIRAIVEDQVKRLVVALGSALSLGFLAASSGASKRLSAPRDYACIATGCKQKSKGPRFSYCCEKHWKQARSGGGRFKGTIAAWRKAAMAKHETKVV